METSKRSIHAHAKNNGNPNERYKDENEQTPHKNNQSKRSKRKHGE